MSTGIAEHFLNYFSLSIADTPELQKEVYRIRYQVYCEELEYEPKENFPDGMEIDIYDQKSIHYLLKHNATESYAGCVRVVLPEKRQCKSQFPWQQVISENNHTINNQELKHQQVAAPLDFDNRKVNNFDYLGDFKSRPNSRQREVRREVI